MHSRPQLEGEADELDEEMTVEGGGDDGLTFEDSFKTVNAIQVARMQLLDETEAPKDDSCSTHSGSMGSM